MKTCACCKQQKDESEFRSRADRPGGIAYHCKSCSCQKAKDHYWRNAEAKRAYSKNYRKLHPDKIREDYKKYNG